MALQSRPHSVSRYAVSEGDSAETFNTPLVNHTPTTIRGQITPMTPSMQATPAFMNFNRPHLFLCNVTETVAEGDYISYGSRWFLVKTPPEVWNAQSIASCLAVALEELDHNPLEP